MTSGLVSDDDSDDDGNGDEGDDEHTMPVHRAKEKARRIQSDDLEGEVGCMANPQCTETPFLVIMMKRDDDALYLHGAKERREGFRASNERGEVGCMANPQ